MKNGNEKEEKLQIFIRNEIDSRVKCIPILIFNLD